MNSSQLEKRSLECRQIMMRMKPLLLEGYSASPGNDPLRQNELKLESKKSFRDLVTKFDRQIEAALLSELSKLYPLESIVGEEDTAQLGSDPRAAAKKSQHFWVVDPIDGTTNFARAYPFFCSTIALLEWQPDGSTLPLLGITYNPVSDEMFWAFRGGGAWLNRERMRVTTIRQLEQSLLTTGFASLRSTEDPRCFELFSSLTSQTLGVRRDGSAALDMAYVAAGRIDAYWEWGLSAWDIGAGWILVQEAGGQVTKHGGQIFDVFDGEVLASNATLHQTMIEKLT